MEHLTFEDLFAALQGEVSFSVLDQRAHRHLLETCGDCRRHWLQLLTNGRRSEIVNTPASNEKFPVPTYLPEDDREISLECLSVIEWLLLQSREAARFAREDLNRLLRLSIDRWPQRVARARTRFRSRAFIELLIEESRRRIRTASREAITLAELVPIALVNKSASQEHGWAGLLLARGAAHRANALRVSGDFPSAESTFAELRRDLLPEVPASSAVRAEIDSLEASLRIDQCRFASADALLTQAGRLYQQTDDSLGLSRTLIKRSNLLRILDRPQEVLPLLDRAASLFDPREQPYLHFCTVHGRVNALLDLDRPQEARTLLDTERACYLESGDEHTAALFSFMNARAELASGQFVAALGGFEATRDQFLALGRTYDAIQASLYLADALLAAGRMADLRRLAADLVPLFHARGVERETLASLRLLAQAVEAETVTAALLAQLRRSLHPAAAAAPSLVPDG